MKGIYERWKLQKQSLLLMLGFVAGAWLFGTILVAVIMKIVKGVEDYPLLGSVMGLIVWAACTLFYGMMTLEKSFCMAVSMGRSRKEFLLSYWIISTINTIIEVAVILLLDGIERLLAAWLYRGMPCVLDLLGQMKDWRLLLGVILLLPAFRLFMGMLVMKFQRQAFWGIWAAWMLGSIGLPRLAHFEEKNEAHPAAQMLYSLQQVFTSLGETGIFLLAVAAAVILFLIAGMVLKKQAVTYI